MTSSPSPPPPTTKESQESRPSPLEWNAVLAKSNANTNVGNGGKKEVTMEQVRAHHSRGDVWMVVRGKAYDVTRYLDYHPGGVNQIMRAAGDDATALFDEYHKWVNVQAMLNQYFIGNVIKPLEAPRWPSLDQWTRVKMLARRRVSTDAYLVAMHGVGEQRPWRGPWHVKLRVVISGKVIERPYTPLPTILVPEDLVDPKPGLGEPLVFLVKEYTQRRIMSWCLARAPLPENVVEKGGSLQGEAQPRCLHLQEVPMLWETKSCVGLVCAGTGVAPMFQILVSALQQSESSKEQRFWLVWVNRSALHVPLVKELAQLIVGFEGRLSVLHVLSSSEANGMDLLKVGLPDNLADSVRIRSEVHIDRDRFFQLDTSVLPPVGENQCVCYCGTWEFERVARTALLSLGFATSSIVAAS